MYRAVHTGVPTVSTLQLASFISQWAAMTIFTLQKEGLRIDMCTLIITNHESPECPEDLTSSSLATTSPTKENIDVYAIM